MGELGMNVLRNGFDCTLAMAHEAQEVNTSYQCMFSRYELLYTCIIYDCAMIVKASPFK